MICFRLRLTSVSRYFFVRFAEVFVIYTLQRLDIFQKRGKVYAKLGFTGAVDYEL